MFVILADAAYAPTERLIPMFYGINKKNAKCDALNFYASQCRIRIEMAFGLMQMKWGILWCLMRVKLQNIQHIIISIARLHNFIINERIFNDEEPEDIGTGTYNPTIDDILRKNDNDDVFN